MPEAKDAMQRIEEFKAVMQNAIEPARMGYIIQRLAHTECIVMSIVWRLIEEAPKGQR
ncbi:MAG: hypothetical protein IJ555_03000 [Ruminococcus sp.]|nr:hypothetical protein [Ruminococcus sp.]